MDEPPGLRLSGPRCGLPRALAHRAESSTDHGRGHRFRSGFEVTAGVSWDLDNFGRAPFDGGHLRLSAGW